MTTDQLNKAVSIDREIMLIRTIVKEIEETSLFNRHESMGEGIRGLKKVLKEPYVEIVKALNDRIKNLREEIASL